MRSSESALQAVRGSAVFGLHDQEAQDRVVVKAELDAGPCVVATYVGHARCIHVREQARSVPDGQSEVAFEVLEATCGSAVLTVLVPMRAQNGAEDRCQLRQVLLLATLDGLSFGYEILCPGFWVRGSSWIRSWSLRAFSSSRIRE